ncbi:glycosyltransferase family 2 protein [Paracraurococcus ruber]|uniref:Glycosyltransferase n=1 Tax=Paracraurococcus ruber TaxID=77675 RepID=A0ABS1CRP5_9PROT|nr:glycosyltransferase family 2 protein [Paracraurococcus ruber]MBK1657033.1 glycosyltransferase [Paracraurococcus ruber]TDG32525.1 glycosyltransferase [Paracraurococcus ruber]
MDSSSTSGGAPAVSIVAPCYNEAECLREFHQRAAAAARGSCGDSFEIVLVDDGSRDGTWGLIEEIARQDPHVVGVRLMRNHGHQLAASAGLALARGGRVMLIDADLQDPPELLAPMMARMDEGADVVFGQRTARHAETWFKKATAFAFYRLLSRLAAVPIPRDTGDFRLMRRRVVDVLVAMPERQRFLRGLVSWVGGRQVALQYERQSRFAGHSKYPLRKMIQFAVDAITSFSVGPLRYATYLGLIAAGLGLLLLLYTLWQWVLGATVIGWSSTMTAIVVFGAVQLIVLGIQGEYVGRLFQEAKARPLFLIDRVVAGGADHRLPMEFSGLAPGMQREVWDAVRGLEVVAANDQDVPPGRRAGG